MKIGIFGESYLPIYDGVGRVMKAYAECLRDFGHDVYVITPYYPNKPNVAYEDLGYNIIDYKSFKFYKGLPYRIGIPFLDKNFNKTIKNLDLDIIHVHGPAFSGRLGLRIAKQKKIPCVGTFHTKFYDDILSITHSRILAYLGAKITGRFYSKCTEAWAVSQGSAQTLKSYGCTKDIRVMKNGTDARELNLSLLDDVKAKYGIREDIPVLFFAGRINWNKGLKRCIDALNILKNKKLDFQFIIAGNGPHYEEVSAYIKSVGLESNVKMIGFISDREVLDCLYHLSTIFLFPSLYDTSSLVVREAAMMKRCSLVISGSCAAEVICDMQNGLLAQDTDQDVADKLYQYFNLPSIEREKMQETAFITIPRRWEDIVRMAEKIYLDLIEANRCRGRGNKG